MWLFLLHLSLFGKKGERIAYENESEISKFDVPKVLSTVMNNDKMPSNIISGFKHTGLYPFDPNNVDYSKIVLRIVQENKPPENYQQTKSHITLI